MSGSTKNVISLLIIVIILAGITNVYDIVGWFYPLLVLCIIVWVLVSPFKFND